MIYVFVCVFVWVCPPLPFVPWEFKAYPAFSYTPVLCTAAFHQCSQRPVTLTRVPPIRDPWLTFSRWPSREIPFASSATGKMLLPHALPSWRDGVHLCIFLPNMLKSKLLEGFTPLLSLDRLKYSGSACCKTRFIHFRCWINTWSCLHFQNWCGH